MCGICGIVTSSPGALSDRTIIERMCGRLTHRGPDDEGYYLDSQVQLGMRRLSIIDLVSGQQPMTNERETLWLVFNGEIYNYQELRVELEQRGHTFASQSDSEVVVHAYEEYGTQCVSHFNGMFAFAIWDRSERRLTLVRDRLGIKPLYYWVGREQLIFASELKALLAHPEVPREIDYSALDQFLSLEYIPAPRTIFADIHKLPPGHLLVYEEGKVTLQQYWEVPFQPLPLDNDACVEELTSLLRDAVRLRMISDVPLGAFLSGGIDSSAIVAFMSEASQVPIQTFSIGFEDASYNELPYAELVAKQFGTAHEVRMLNPDIAAMAERLVGHMDEPFGDFSMFPTHLISAVAGEQVKVILSGDGGDEMFGGYDTYVAQAMDGYYRKLPSLVRQRTLPSLLDRLPPRPAKKGLINKAKRFVEGARLPSSLQHTRWMLFMSEEEKGALYRPELQAAVDVGATSELLMHYFQKVADQDWMAQQQFVDVKTYLADDILTKVDRMSMAASLEVRVPFLDHRIVEFALNLPPQLKLNRNQTKVILRQAMQDKLPPAVLGKPKQGFSIPLKHWLRGPLRPLMLDLLSPSSLSRRGLFEPAVVRCWIDEHLEQRVNHSHRLWSLMVFELWHRKVLDASRAYA